VIYSRRIFTIFPSGRDRTVEEGIIKHAGFFQLQLWLTVVEFFPFFLQEEIEQSKKASFKHAGFFQLQL
jgi:hypothetical protein